MIDWSKGITSRYYAMFVDGNTWRDTEMFNMIDGSIKFSDSGTRGSADLTCRDFNTATERWVRIYLDARQGSDGELVPLFTGLASAPSISYDGRRSTNNVQCYSVLSPAEKILLPLGWYIHSGASGALVIKDLLKDSTPAPIVIDEESPTLGESIVAENNESKLTMVDKILTAMNWRIIIEGDGTIRLTPAIVDSITSEDLVDRFDSQQNDIFELNLTVTNNWYDVPNVFRAVGSGVTAIAKDENPDSPYSIPNRGREIWKEERNCVLKNNEKITEYADRRLKEEQNVHVSVDYSRRFKPGIHIGDFVSINYPDQKISGVFKIESQSLTLGHGVSVSEQVKGI